MLTQKMSLRCSRWAGRCNRWGRRCSGWATLAAVALTFGCALLQAEPASASLPTYWRYSHPEAKVLMGIDVRGILNSPLGQKLFAEMKSMGGSFTSSANKEEMELLQGIERVFLSAPAQAGATDPSIRKEAVVALQGTFDLAKLRKMLAARGQRSIYKGIEMWTEKSSPVGGAGAVMALVSQQVVLLGDQGSLRAAIDQYASADPARAYDPVFLRATELAPLYEIWFVGDIPPGDLAGTPGEAAGPEGAGAAAMGPLSALQGVESFEAGISIKQGMQLQFNLNTPSPAEATKMAQGLAGLLMFASAAKSDSPELGEFLKRVKFGSAGAQVQVSAAWTQSELEKGVMQMRAGVVKAARDPMAAVPTRPAANGAVDWNVAPQQAARATIANAEPAAAVEPQQPVGPLTVKILNADGGNQEVVIRPAKP